MSINSKIDDKPLSRLLDRGSYGIDSLYFETNFDYSVKDNKSKKNILIVGNSHAEDLLEVFTYSKSVTDKFNITLTSPIKRNADYNYQISCFYNFLKTGSTLCEESEKNNDEFSDNLTRQYEWANYIILASNWLPKHINNIGQLKDIINQVRLDGKVPIIALPTIEFEQTSTGAIDIEVFARENKRYPNASELLHLEKLAYRDLGNNKMDKITWNLQILAKEMKVKVLDKKDFQCDMKAKRCFVLNDNGYKIIYDHAHYSKEGAIFYSKIQGVNEVK